MSVDEALLRAAVEQTERRCARGWASRRLVELDPYYWAAATRPDHTWPDVVDHEW